MRYHFDTPHARGDVRASGGRALVVTALMLAAACSDHEDVAGPRVPIPRPVGPIIDLDSTLGVNSAGAVLQKVPTGSAAIVTGAINPGTIVVGTPKLRPCKPGLCVPPSMWWSYQADDGAFVSVPAGAPAPVVSASHALAVRVDAKEFKDLTYLDGYITVRGKCVHLLPSGFAVTAPYTDFHGGPLCGAGGRAREAPDHRARRGQAARR